MQEILQVYILFDEAIVNSYVLYKNYGHKWHNTLHCVLIVCSYLVAYKVIQVIGNVAGTPGKSVRSDPVCIPVCHELV